ncbi:hypothetical protein CCAN12_810050 [Capnocytophaga canimorsus]|uniref:Uncharacterized protein n=1 Tax=Capnocytophaga canimorsus TaxID=28188 RepID=A0A0B7HU37_9FLAO|nr:hypothetical protein CCAN12_810050 [Capnocytophaga canimorsus]CEN48830.1 hypothetical protein CCAN11_1820011 [Capnocytophaga canimorsus]
MIYFSDFKKLINKVGFCGKMWDFFSNFVLEQNKKDFPREFTHRYIRGKNRR